MGREPKVGLMLDLREHELPGKNTNSPGTSNKYLVGICFAKNNELFYEGIPKPERAFLSRP